MKKTGQNPVITFLGALSVVMKFDLEHKIALVTASSGGIGLAIARSLLGEGAKVVVNGRTRERVDQAISELRSELPDAELIPLVADNGTSAGCAETVRCLPEVDILVNNLGVYEAVGFFDETDEDWRRLYESNIMSGVRLSRHYLAAMISKGEGRVVFISSESGVCPAPEMAHYSATKTMQLSIARSLAELTKGTEVTVNSVLPGPTRTDSAVEFIQNLHPGLAVDAAERRFMAENRPASLIGRLIDPKEIGDIVCFLSSPRASAINGACIRAEGGLIRSVF
jgi:3-oxoacyl-[acyl-carrier protein] reductase